MAVLERIIPLFLTVCATVKAQGKFESVLRTLKNSMVAMKELLLVMQELPKQILLCKWNLRGKRKKHAG